MSRNIFAYTEPGPEYPEYVSINEKDGIIQITVRGPKKPPDANRSYVDAGDVACMTIPREQAAKMYRALLREFTPTDNA